jgi:aspartyl-tRNA(Asn)/glutamyl-tRNA(Gln) amidotransferase subunit A
VELKSATQIAKSVQSGKTSAREVVDASLARIEAIDGRLQAFLTVDPRGARGRADEIDGRIEQGEQLPLAGVPIAVKDNICTRGLRTTCGSRILGNYVPPYSATAVARLEEAGAIVIGKTNCDEFGMGSSTENSAYQITRNPFDPERVPGGSSGGSAVAVAAGLVPLALGSDTGGSVRQPASFCNVLGLKPTYGRISRYGLVAFASSLDVIGVIGCDASDLAVALGVAAGRDVCDSTSAHEPVPDYQAALGASLEGLRLGIPREYFTAGLNEEVRLVVDEAIRNLESLGCRLVEVSLPHTEYAIADYYIVAPAEASSNLARFDGVRYGFRTRAPQDLQDMYKRSRSEGFGGEVRRRIMIGTYALSAGYYEAYYGLAMKVRTLLRQDFEKALNRVDVIIGPVSPTPPFRIGEKTDDPLQMYLSDIYTVTANLAGIPAISVPARNTPAGLPVGVQILGPAFGEPLLLRVARAYLEAFPAPRLPLEV